MLLPSLLVATLLCSANGESRLDKTAVGEQKPNRYPGCWLPKDEGVCDVSVPRFYFDAETKECKNLRYRGCGGNENNFRTKEDCVQRCIEGIAETTVALTTINLPGWGKRSDAEPKPGTDQSCLQPLDGGPCEDYKPRFYYDVTFEECRKFFHGGCGGNENIFATIGECEQKCVAAPITSLPLQLCLPTFVTEVEALSSKFNELNEAPDVIDSFEKLGEQSRELFTLASPVSKCLLAVLTKSWEVNSKEAMALKKLHNVFKDGASQQEAERNRDTFHLLGTMANLTAANRSITDATNQIRSIKQQLFYITVSPLFMMDPYFSFEFYNIHDSRSITRKLCYDSFVACRAPNPVELAKFAKVQGALNRLSSRLNSTLRAELARGWDMKIDDFLRDSLRAPSEYVNKMAELLDAVNESSLSSGTTLYSVMRNALHETYYKMSGPASWFPYRCRDLPQTFEINKTAFLTEMTKTRGDLLRIMLISSLIEAKKSRYGGGDRPIPADYDVTEHTLQAMNETGREIAKFALDIRDFSS